MNILKCGVLCVVPVLRAFAKLRKAIISLVMSVRLSAWNNSAPIGRIFIKFDIWGFFENLSRKLNFHCNRTRKTGTLHGDEYKFLSYPTQFFLEWKIFQTNYVDKLETRIMLYYIFPSTKLQVIEITATWFDFNQSSFRRAYEPVLVTICCRAFAIPDGLQFSYAYNYIVCIRKL